MQGVTLGICATCFICFSRVIRRPLRGLLACKSNFWFPPPIFLPRRPGEPEKSVDPPPWGDPLGGGTGEGKG